MADSLDTALQMMWKRIYAQCQTIAQQEVQRLFGSNVRGGALNPGAIQPSGTVGQVLTTTAAGVTSWASAGSTLPAATTTTLGSILVDRTPPGSDPIALSLPNLASARGVPQLTGDVELPSAYLPTPAGTITEYGRWIKHGPAIISGSQSWENNALGAMSVVYDQGEFKGWFEAGWNLPAIGYATSPDGITWTQYTGNPILGQGAGGVAGAAERTCMVISNGLYLLYFADASNNISRTTSTNGITGWTTPVVVLPYNAVSWSVEWANSSVWYEPDADRWVMLVEGRATSSGPWQIALATSPDGLTWTLNSAQWLTSLQIVSGGSCSHPRPAQPAQIDGLYHLWYHATNVAGAVPTYIYHATSSDLVTWTLYGTNPVLDLTGEPTGTDQVADPTIVEVDGQTFLYYSQADNTTSSGVQCVAVYAGTLHEIVMGIGPIIRGDVHGIVPVGNLPLGTTSAPGVLQVGTGLSVTSGVVSAPPPLVVLSSPLIDPATPDLIWDPINDVIVGPDD